MKKIITMLMLILSTLSFAAKKLYVGTNAEFKPYEYLENNKMVGFDIELMELLGKELGYEIKWQDMSFDGLLPALQMKKIDAVIAGMSATPERKKAVSFSIPYIFFEGGHSVIVNSKSTFKKKEDLKGKTIGVQLGTIQEQFTKDNDSIPKLYNNFTEALLDLQNQKIDAVIIAEVTGNEYLKTMKGIKKIDTIKDKLPSAAIAFRKVDSELAKKFSDAILKLKNTPEYAKLVKKYFPEHYDNFIANQN
ncbi:basic amino acid ABC transporter substrate-binding protein [Fusobacterium nucleatum]|uniref:basic amino acid ABC transporter substrate-binding protein n=1 Tax=Fusobacterium nucleatum TaxID=851 RepID=UPI003CFDC92C